MKLTEKSFDWTKVGCWCILPITHISRLNSFIGSLQVFIDVVGTLLLSEVDESLVGIGLVHQGHVSLPDRLVSGGEGGGAMAFV